MRQESKKSKRWLYLVIAAVALLAVAGVVVGLIFGLGGPGATGEEEAVSSKLYWNVDGLKFQNPEDPMFSIREPGADGLYHIRFAVDGEHVEYTATDKKLVNYIDAKQLMGLELDDSGNILDIIPLDQFTTQIANAFFVQDINGNTLTINSSVALNGMKQIITLDDSVSIYDVRPDAEKIGGKGSCEILDKVMVYGDMDENPTHIYITERQREAEVYWRIARMYSSADKGTSRKPDENGVYTVLAAKDGGQVEVKFRAEHKDLVDLIDKGGRYDGAFAPIFDEEGYVVELLGIAKALRGKSAAPSYDITELSEDSFGCEYLMPGKEQGKTWSGKIHPDCKIYNVSDGGTADLIGEETTLQMGDRVVAYSNTRDEAILIYVVNRLVDSPMYYNVNRMYSGGATTRKPVNGYYEFELAVNGKVQKFKTSDKDIASKVDAYSYQMFGLKVEGDIILRAYNPECVTGYYSVGPNYFIQDIIGPILTIAADAEATPSNPIMAGDCKVYNVTNVGAEIGAEDTLQIGDQIISYANPAGELKYVYIVNRKVDSPVYWNHTRKYSTKTMETTRQPDENGYYVFRVAANGKDTTVRTKSKKLATQMDSYNPQWFALQLNGDIVQKVFPAKMATGGSVRASYFAVKSISSEEIVTYSLAGSGTTVLKPSADLKIYNVASAYEHHWGEQTQLKVGDQIHALTDRSGKTVVIYIRTRKVDSPLYWNKTRKYNTTTAQTTRKPDEEGYYVYDLAVNGEVKQFKTKDKEIANMVDSYRIAFALKVEGDIIKHVYSSTAAKGIKGSTASWLDVMSIDGNQVYVQQNIGTASDYGKGYEIKLAKNYVVYDACGYVNAFGSKVSLGIGDRIHAFTNDDGEVCVIYIVRDNTRQAGGIGYCDHCNKEVVWAPWSGETFYASDGHYHLTHDVAIAKQLSIGKENGGEVYDIVLDLNGNTLTTNARSFLVWGGSSFTLTDNVGTGTVAAKGSTGNSGNVLVTGGGKFNLYGGTLTLREDAVNVKRGGIIHLSGDNSVVNMYGGTISGGKATEGGGVYVSAGKFNLAGGTITDCYGATGGNVYVNGGVFDMTGGTVTNGETGSAGGNFQVNINGVLNVSGGTITAGEAKRGGNISIMGNASAAISGGLVEQGKAELYGGNVFVYGNGKATVSGSAQITDGTAGTSGGNIYISEESGDTSGKLPELTVSGGKLSGGKLESGLGSNIQSYRAAVITISGGNIAGDILLGADADGFSHKVVLSGAPVIGKGLRDGLNLGSRTADVSGLTKGADITVSTAGVFTTQMDNADSYKDYFTPYDSAMRVVAVDKALVCGFVAPCAHCNGADAVWSNWTGGALPQKDGHYRLTKDASTNQQTVGVEGGEKAYDVVIDLNGKTLTGHTRSFLIWYGSKLSVMDNAGGGAIEAKGVSNTANAGAILLQRGAEFNLYSGTLRPVSEGVKAGKGGIIHMSTATTTVNMYGGTIEGGHVATGGAAYIQGGIFNMYGGMVTGGSAGSGGNFYVEDGQLNVQGGTIEKGTSDSIGGNIYADKVGKINLSGGTVSQGAAVRGGNIGCYTDAVIAITGGKVEKGDASMLGGNIFISRNGAVTVSGNAVIADGVATTSGGNIYIAEEKSNESGKLPSLTITGGTISGGKLDNGKGDNILTYRGAVVTISGGNIAGDVRIGNDLDGYVHSLSITGKPVITAGISGGLDLGGRKLNAELLEDTARICISGIGVFTEALTDPNAHMNKFQAYGEDLDIGILGNALFCDRYTECEHCNRKVLWTPWEGGSAIPEGHIYLSKDATYTGNAIIEGTASDKIDIAIDLNGNKLTSNARLLLRQTNLSVFDSVGTGIWECKGVANNGCVYRISTGSTVNLYGGTIAEHKDHVAFTGGVVHIGAANATLNMFGGKIQGGDDVGAVLVSPGTFNMIGGVIEGKNPDIHNVTVQGASNVTIGGNAQVNGGILVEDCNSFKITGSPVINKGKEFGVKLPAGKKLTIENMTADAKIGITAPGAFVTNADATVLESWKLNNFTSDDLTKRIIVSGQDLTLETVTSITRCALGHTSHDGMTCPAEIVVWKPWTSTTSLPTADNYFLTGNVTISPKTVITGTVQIDLNGCDIVARFNDSVTGNGRGMLSVSGNLGVTDLSGKTKLGAIRAELDTANIADKPNFACGAGVVAYVSGKMTLYNGTLDGSACATNRTGGTTVAVESTQYGVNGIFTMYGGTIQGVNGAKGTNGSTLSGWSKSIMNIHGGELIGKSAHKGANIYTTGELNITGGKLTGGVLRKNGTTNGLGQNVFFGGASYDLTISGDAEFNGGVYVDSCKSITLAGTPQIMGDGIYGLRLPAGVKADVNGLETDAQIGITLVSDGAFATGTDATKLDALRHSFITDVATKEVVLVGNDLVQQDIPFVKKCLVGHETHEAPNDGCTHGEILNWLPWREKTLPTEAGNYYLLNDINLTRSTALVSGLNLDLNGHKITYTVPAGKTANAFSVAKDNVVNITDLSGKSTPGSIVVKHADANGEIGAGAVMYLSNGSVVSLYNVTVDASALTSTQKGSAAFAVEGGTLNVNNARILGVNCKPNADNTKNPHGSTIVAWGGNVNINGGELIGASGGLSGNIYTTGNLTITGGKFVGGETYLENSASNIFVNGANSVVVISGDDINIDGGVYLANMKSLEVGGKTVIRTTMDSVALYDVRMNVGPADYYTLVYNTSGEVVKIAPVSEVVEPEQKLFVGYDREIITPDDPVPLAGYGNTSQRVSETVLDDLFVTCIAMTDESGNTVLMLTQDTINSSVVSTLRNDISSATGVPASNIIVAATHTHSAPASSGTNISAWKVKYKAAAIKAAQDAIADEKEASMYVGAVATDGMNFTRHYVMEDGTVTGSNFGNWNQAIVGHQHENDPLMQVVKFDRAGEDDVYMINFQSHPTMTGGYSTTDISADFIGAARSYVESQITGAKFAYFTGAAGNEVSDSRITSEKNNLEYEEYGQKLGAYLVNLLPSLTQVKTTSFEVASYTHAAPIDHSMDDKLAQAQEVVDIWYNGPGTSTENKNAARAKAHEYGFSSEYHASAVISKAGMGATANITVSAVSIGNWSMVVAPYEMFSVQGLYIKENSPFDMTFVVTCANGSNGYMAPADAYDYQSYESTTCKFSKGIAEDLADIYLKLLLVLKRTVN